MGYVTLEGDKCEEGWMADGCENWFVRGYAMLWLGLKSNSSVPCSIRVDLSRTERSNPKSRLLES